MTVSGKIKRRHGFTLIELLVVIAIISLLVSILLPSLSTARYLAMDVKCLAGLRGMGTATTMYLSDNDVLFQGGASAELNYATALSSYIGLTEQGAKDLCYSARDGRQHPFICPTTDASSQLYPQSQFDYAFNGYMQYHSPEEYSHASEKVIFIDGDGSMTFFYWMWTSSPKYRHSRTTANMAFIDGHAECRDQEDLDNVNFDPRQL